MTWKEARARAGVILIHMQTPRRLDDRGVCLSEYADPDPEISEKDHQLIRYALVRELRKRGAIVIDAESPGKQRSGSNR